MLFQTLWLSATLQRPRPDAMKEAALVDIDKRLVALEKSRSDLEANWLAILFLAKSTMTAEFNLYMCSPDRFEN